MIKVFDKIKAKCVECGTPLDGTDLSQIGDYFYCRADYERKKEQPENVEELRESDFAKEILKTDSTNLAYEFNFNNWTASNATVSSSTVWVGTSTSGKIYYQFTNLTFGLPYWIRVKSNTTGGNIYCYNSTDGTLEIGHDTFETKFICLDQYIEFRNSTIATNTIEVIEIRAL